MALPTTISGVALPANSFKCKPIKSAGGAFYVVVLDSADNSIIEVHKATDPTSGWSEQDSGNKPDLADNVVAIAVDDRDDVIHIATQEDASGATEPMRVAYHAFDMSSDSWTTTDDEIATPPDAGGSNHPVVDIKTRSDGDIVVIYDSSEKLHGTDWDVVMSARNEGAGWTSDVQLSPSGVQVRHEPWCAVLGDDTNDRIHVFWYESTGTPDLHARTIRSDNSLSTQADLGETPSGVIQQAAVSYDAGGTQTIVLLWRETTSLVSYLTAADADSPSWGSGSTVSTITVKTISAVAAISNVVFDLIEDGSGNLHALMVNNSDSDLEHWDDSSGWAYIEDAVTGTINRVAANVYSRSGSDVIAYLYDDGGTIKYNEISLGAGSQTGVATPAAASWNVPNVTASVGPVTATATPAAASWAVPNAAGTVSQTAQVAPAAASWAIPAATAVLGAVSASVTPASVTWSVPAATAVPNGVTGTATPVAATWSVPNATASGAQVGAATPAVATWGAPNATGVPGPVTGVASPAAAGWSVPAVTATATYSAQASAAAASWSVPVATAAVGAVTAQATPATASWSVPNATRGSTTAVQATPAVASWNVPAAVAQAAISVSATPASASWAVTSASVVVGTVSAQVMAATATWSAPDASGAVVQIAAATPAIASWSVPMATVPLGALISQPNPAVATWVVPGVTGILPTPDVLLAEMLLNGVWTEFTEDILGREAVHFARGIGGSQPTDLMADVGRASFLLDNGPKNSAGLSGYYTPGHPNQRSGFRHGVLVRMKLRAGGVVSKYWWHGRVKTIDPDPGIHGRRGAKVTCEDWFAELQDLDDLRLSLRTNVTVGTALADLVALVSRTPANTDFATGSDTLLFIYDDLGGVTTGTNVAQGLMQTERGKLFTRGDDTDGETLVFEDRNADALKSVLDSFDDTEILDVEVPSALDNVFNGIVVVVFPREVGPNSNQAVVKLDSPVEIPDGQVVEFIVELRDPDQRAVFIGAQDGQQPVGNTDFTANTAEDGSGSDVTGDVAVTVDFFGSVAGFRLERTTGSGTVYVRGVGGAPGMQARAQGLFRYAPLDIRNDISATAVADSIDKFGKRPLPSPYEAPYQSDRNVGQGIADQIANLYAGVGNVPTRVRLLTEKDSILQRVLQLDIGDKIQITEPQTGVTEATVVIRSIDVEIPGHGRPGIWLGLAPTDTSSALVLDHPTAGKLNANALAFG